MFNKNFIDEDMLDFNFWPSFTDLMLTISMILAALLVIKFGASAIQLQQKQESKKVIIAEIKVQLKTKYGTDYKETEDLKNDTIVISNKEGKILKISSENDYQQISFYEKILFDRGGFNLKTGGKEVLKIVGNAIKQKSNNIKLVQIEGHTDTLGIKLDNYPKEMGNIVLGSRRAVDVYQFFMDEVGLDPASLPMSATTFGEYAPPSRKLDSNFNKDMLSKANNSEEQQASNRRIELKIFFSAK